MVLTITRNLALALVAFLACGVAQDKPQKQAKDQAEADLINSIPKTQNPAEKLKILDKWAKDYPQSDYAPERLQELLATYQALNRPRDVFNTAAEILKNEPNDFSALRGVLGSIYQINNGNPPVADLDTAEKICNHMMTDLDAIFASDKMPAGMNAEQWGQVKPAMKVFTQRTIGWIYLMRKDNARAEVEFTKTLQLDPAQAQASYWLATALFAQRTTKPEKQPPSIFEFARAAEYDGPNSLPADFRKQLQASVAKTYKSYHGSEEGFDQLLAAAKANPLPPADFTIKDIGTINREKAEEQAKVDASDPVMFIWRTIKTGLTGDNPDAFFEMTVKDVALPGTGKFKGKIISMTPAMRPKELVLAVEKPDVGDVTLKLDEGNLPGQMDPGSEIQFTGTAKAYKKEPYMLTFEVEKDQISGWTGKNPAPVKKAVPKKAAKQ